MDKEEMLVVSTGNVSKATAELLDRITEPTLHEPCLDFAWLTVYRKGTYGWFVFLGDWAEDADDGDCTPVPKDLKALVLLAQREHCNWLCLDRDADLAEGYGIQSYNW